MDRSRILEKFNEQSEYLNERVSAGIEENRKGNARIIVKDKDGNLLPDVSISARQISHEFKFGANLFMLDELETDEKNEQYKARFSNLFNMATLPFYWDSTEPEENKTRYEKDSEKLYRRPPIDLCIEFCKEHNIEPREHALAYEHFFPEWLNGADTERVKTALEKRYKEISERYADLIPTIEVTNEMEWPQGKTEFYDDKDYVLWCFKMAEKYFPNNQLCINEHTGLPWWDKCRATDKYYSYILANMLRGARIDAIGMQFHMFFRAGDDEYNASKGYYNPKWLYDHLDLYADFDKPIQLTEVTIPAYSNDPEDEAIQAEIIEKLYSIWFSHKNVEQIIYWNLVDGYAAFAPQGDMTAGENYYHGGLLRFDMTPKPAYLVLENLIKNVWNTKEEITSDANGTADFRGFYGEYEIIINGDKSSAKKIMLSSNKENTFEIIL